jgi:hypothetical protein
VGVTTVGAWVGAFRPTHTTTTPPASTVGGKERTVTDPERDLVLAMLGQAVEAVTRGDWHRAEGWCAGAWDLIEQGRIEFIDTNDKEAR